MSPLKRLTFKQIATLASTLAGLSFIAVLSLTHSGCAGGPQLSNYPIAEVDRPYSRPKGIHSWSVVVFTGLIEDRDSSLFIPPIPFPFFFQFSLLDSWDLLASYRDLGLRIGLGQSEHYYTGFEIGLGYDYSPVTGVTFEPELTLGFRIKAGGALAWDFELGGSGLFQTDGEESDWTIEARTGLLFQFNEKLSLKPEVSVALTDDTNLGIRRDEISTSDTTKLSYSPEVELKWNFSRQWEFSIDYGYSGFGEDEVRSHLAVLVLTFLW